MPAPPPGRQFISGNWRGLVVTHAHTLDSVLGGYQGHPNNAGGRDVWVLEHRPGDERPAGKAVSDVPN